jgi:hypothetical protein
MECGALTVDRRSWSAVGEVVQRAVTSRALAPGQARRTRLPEDAFVARLKRTAPGEWGLGDV